MKKTTFKKICLIMISIVFVVNSGFAQSNSQNNNGNGLWQAIGHDTVFTNRVVKMDNSIITKGGIIAESIITDTATINGGMRVKGLLHIGDSSITIGSTFTPGGQTSNNITTSGTSLNFGNSAFPFSNIRVGIGTQSPAFTLDLRGDGSNTNGGIYSI